MKRSGRKSKSLATRLQIAEFEGAERTRLRRIAKHLQQERFAFGLAKGVLVPRPGKSSRPIVMATIEARIVQRALLDELQHIEALRPHFINENSFGGVQDRGRGHAIRAALETMGSSASYFLRSDIKDFFTGIPREVAMNAVLPLVDEPTKELLRRAVHVELENAEHLGALRAAFPDEERGVAQGFCLSSLLGNIVLADFDRRMNARGVRCLRYVDDFLLLADGERRTMTAFTSALGILGALGLEAYDPRVNSAKAECGPTMRAFDFLGCSIQPGLVAPSAKSKARLLEKVDERLHAGIRHIEREGARGDRRSSAFRVIADVSNIVHGWRESFDFCDQPFVFGDLDREIDRRLEGFMRRFWRGYSSGTALVQRAILGVPRLAESRVRTTTFPRASSCATVPAAQALRAFSHGGARG